MRPDEPPSLPTSLLGWQVPDGDEETILVGHDDLDARLARVGYSPRALANLTNVRLPEIRRFHKEKLDAERTDELFTFLRKAGLPI